MQTHPANFIVLVVTVALAVVDRRYVGKGGKPASKISRQGFWMGLGLIVLLLVVLGLRGASEDSLIYAGVSLLIYAFFFWQISRLISRRRNPIP